MSQILYKTPAESQVEMTELVLPDDTNLLGNLLGGRLMHWLDIAGALAASRHSNKVVATAAVDNIEFNNPVRLGEIVVLKAKITWVGRTSMEVKINVFSENVKTGKRKITNKAYIVFVALDENEKPAPVPKLIPVSEEEKKDFKEAQNRKCKRKG